MSRYRIIAYLRVLSLALALTRGPILADAATLSFQPPTAHVPLGNTASLDLEISNAQNLAAFQFDLTFDPAILAVDSVTEGALLPGAGPTFFLPGSIDNSAGTLSFIADTILGPTSGTTGDGVLVHLHFRAVGLGSSTVRLADPIFLDAASKRIAVSAGNANLDVVASSVPEPRPLALTGIMGLAVLAISRRRLRRCN